MRRGYDQVSGCYGTVDRERRRRQYKNWLARAVDGLSATGKVLDLGCGNGDPAAAILSERCRWVGVDFSLKQLALAKQRASRADLICADMAFIEFAPRSFDAIVSLYAVIHLPFALQPALFSRMRSWLKPRGRLLVTVGHEAWTGTEENWLGVPGATMYWSHADADAYRRLLSSEGFRIAWQEFAPEEGGGHDQMLALLET